VVNFHFDIFAPVYDRCIRLIDPGRLQRLLNLPAGGWLLDAGGGTGRVGYRLRPQAGHLVVSDLSRAMLKQAGCKGDLFPVQTHVEALPFPGALFDGILVVDALHHFCDQATSIGELVRVLKPGGHLVIEEPDISRASIRWLALAEKLALMKSRFLTSAAICELLTDKGLETTVETDGRWIFWVTATKPIR
jgi:ubiquinone/menaquinone biosynthesis C-methylase UbiE